MISVKGRCITPAHEKGIVTYSRRYVGGEGLACIETRSAQWESDYSNGLEYRESPDNGRTWGPWIQEERKEYSVFYGEDEMIFVDGSTEVWNPVHGHFVKTYMTRFFPEGHEKAYRRFWGQGEEAFFDHTRIALRLSGGAEPYADDPVQYEDGVDFDPENPRNPEFLYKNRGYSNPPFVLENGDIVIPIGALVQTGCERAGLDVNKVFPSCPLLHHCVLVARGCFNPETKKYDFTFSEPVILGDMRSSRGIDEPILAELKSGRILMVMRGSNVQSASWRTRIPKDAPSYKWYAYSDDGGKTFTDPEPWHFDDREVIYSSAAFSRFIRSSKTGKLYWIGNITDHTAYGNFPRFPLQIVEVDEETGAAKKESLTVIDTRREGETEKIQLSNFSVLEDRETGCIEVSLAKLGQFDVKRPFFGESWQYEITVE